MKQAQAIDIMFSWGNKDLGQIKNALRAGKYFTYLSIEKKRQSFAVYIAKIMGNIKSTFSNVKIAGHKLRHLFLGKDQERNFVLFCVETQQNSTKKKDGLVEDHSKVSELEPKLPGISEKIYFKSENQHVRYADIKNTNSALIYTTKTEIAQTIFQKIL